MKENTATAKQPTSFGKRQDFGEEMPGSRKDLAERTRQVLSDLANMSDGNFEYTNAQMTAKLREIRRDDIWGPLEDRLSELQSLGASPALAIAWRVLYRGVAASAASTDLKPIRSRYYRMTPRATYVFGLCYESTLKGVADYLEALPLDATWPEINTFTLSTPPNTSFLDGPMIVAQLGEYLEGNPEMSPSEAANVWLRVIPARNGEPKNLISIVRKLGSLSTSPLARAKREVFDEYAPGWRENIAPLFENSLGDFDEGDLRDRFIYRVSANLSHAITSNYPDVNAGGYFNPSEMAILDQHFGSFDLLAEKLYSCIASNDSFDPWTTIKSKKSTQTEDDSTSFESILRPKIMPATRFENLKREAKSGTPIPRQGNVSEADLIELVPFRGIQYGNWATQAERQEMLNLAYDAMNDLALALGVSPQYLALPVIGSSASQCLGLALGARGRGGNAAAHYEPSAHVINLTKTKGGGALAHEWMHAYDHKVGTEPTVKATFASEKPGNEIYEFVNLLRRQNRAMYNAEDFSEAKDAANMRRRDMMVELLLPPSVEKQLFEISGNADSWRIFGAAMVETLSEWSLAPSPVMAYACKGRYLKTNVAQANMESGLMERGVPTAAATALATLWSERVPSSEWIKLDRRLRRETTAHSGQTAYLANAEVLNGNKAVGYWSSPTELFARAGSAVVFDRLREIHGVANGFLDASSDPERFNPEIHKANPNPAGIERERFRKAFSETLLLNMQKEDADATYSERSGTQIRMRF